MKSTPCNIFVWILLGCVPFPVSALEPPAERALIAIVGVNVIPMNGDHVIEDATVLVSKGTITAIGAQGAIAVPKNAYRIQGKGQYLMPGLAEMHAHVPTTEYGATYVEDVLFLYVANGVTLARGMLGAPEHLKLRSDLLAHRILGPRLITSGPSLNGNTVQGPEQGAALVREQKAAGYDFLKLHPGLSRESFLAIAQTAHEVGIPFGGHVSADVGLATTLANGQATIDHLDGYVLASVPEAERAGRHPDDVSLARKFDPALVPEVVKMTRAAGAWIVPTQTLSENMIGPSTPEELDGLPGMRYVPPQLRADYRARKKRNLEMPALSELSPKYLDIRRTIIRSLHEGGAHLLLGSDSPQIFNVPGFAAHRELAAMVDAGLTPYEALSMGTSAPAEFFKQEGRYGTIAVGADADLVLVAANPLVNIANASHISGVMVRGRWLDRAFLDRELRKIEARMSTD